ncbi:DMT family transporter [Poseidonocella sedimentorum]|nr:DMT family transporter [Poseidonocella sedimentorum]
MMTLAMALFAIEDSFIKLASSAVSPAVIVLCLGLSGAPIFALLARLRGLPLWDPMLAHPAVILRTASELVCTVALVVSLALIPLSLASAISQVAPLLVTMGAALFLGEEVGWRRWSAIFVGLAGVMIILRPGFEGFEPAALITVLSALGLAARDVVVRRVPPRLHTFQISWITFLAMIPVGIAGVALTATGAPGAASLPEPRTVALLFAVIGFALSGYYCVVTATRTGDVGFVTPYRYTRLIFAMILGILVFGETPDAPMLIGAALVVASGLYALLREARLKRAERRLAASKPHQALL